MLDEVEIGRASQECKLTILLFGDFRHVEEKRLSDLAKKTRSEAEGKQDRLTLFVGIPA